MNFMMTKTTQKLQIGKNIIRGIPVNMMNINNIIATAQCTDALYSKFFNKAKCYLTANHVFSSIGKIFKIDSFRMFLEPCTFIKKSVFMFAVNRTGISCSLRSKDNFANSTDFVFVNHISYPIMYRISCQV